MTGEQIHNNAEKKTEISENTSILEDYRNWKPEHIEDLKDALRSSSKNFWRNQCQKAVQLEDENWISDFAERNNIDSLPEPFKSISNGVIDQKRKYAAIFIANCALAAIQLKKSSPSSEEDARKAKFADCVKRAIFSRNKTNDLNSMLKTADFLVSLNPTIAIDSKQFLDNTFEDLSNKYPDYEILPVKDLIHYFLNNTQENEGRREFLSKAKFPVVDSDSKDARICQLVIERYGDGKGRLYKDPIKMSSAFVDFSFQESIRDAFNYIQTQYGEECGKSDFRWCVCDWSGEKKTENGELPIVEGTLGKQSVGLAATVAFSQSINRNNFGDGYVFTGKINKDSGKVEKVGLFTEKIKALPSNLYLSFFVPSENYPRVKHLREAKYDIRPAESFVDVTRKIQVEKEEIEREKIRLEKEEQERKWEMRKKVIFMVVVALVLISIAVMIAIFQWNKRNLAEEKEKIAQAGQQAAEAGSLAAEGYKRLAVGDKNTAQTLFAKAISLDDRSEYRSGLLSASFDESIKTKLAWTEKIVDFENSEHFSLQSVAINSTGEMLAVSSSNGQDVQILSTLDGNKMSNFSFEQPVNALALSPNGKFLAVRTKDSKLIVLELDSQKTYFEISLQTAYDERIEHESLITDLLSFNSDGTYLATNSGWSAVIVLDVEAKQIVKKFNHAGEFHDDPQPRLVRILTSTPEKQSKLPDAQINSLAFSQDNYLAYGFKNNPILIRSLKDNSVNKKINSSGWNLNLGFTKNGDLITSTPVAYTSILIGSNAPTSPNKPTFNGITVYTGIEDSLTEQIQPESYSLKQTIRPDFLFAVARNSDYFVTTGDHGYIRFWEGEKQIQQISPFSMGKPIKIMVGENGRVLLLNTEGKIYCWETSISDYNKNRNLEYENYLSENPKTTTIYDDAIVIRDNRTDELVFSFKRGKTPENDPKVGVSPNGNKIAVVLEGKILEVYDANTRNQLFRSILDFKTDVCCLKFSNDGQKLAVVKSTVGYTYHYLNDQLQDIKQSSSVDIINLSNFEIQSKITLPKNLSKNFQIGYSEFSPQGNYFVIPSENSIYLFDSLTGQLKHSIPFEKAECDLPTCQWFEISPDEKHVGITYTGEQVVQLWNIENYRYLVEAIKPNIKSPELFTGIGFTNNGRLLVWSSGGSGRLHFYDTKDKQMLSDLPTDEMILMLKSDSSGNLFVNARHKLESDTLNLILFGSPSSIISAVFEKNRFRVNSQTPNSPNKPSFQIVAVAKDGSELKGTTDFVRLSAEKAKLISDETNNICLAFRSPTFNPYPITFNSPAEFCANYPLIDIRNARTGKYSQSQQEWETIRQIDIRENYYGLVYLSNGAANKLLPELVDIINAKVQINIEHFQNGNHKIVVSLLADNASSLSSEVNLQTDNNQQLIIGDYIEIYDYQGKNLLTKIQLSEVLKEDSNSKTVFEIPVGDIKPGFETDLFIRFSFSAR